MLRVLIADDEERICKLIRILADWQRLGMEVVGMAGNGLEALEMVRSLSPDILITDIRMPGCDGLELIRRAKEIAPGLEVIIISGYAQFDYAQTAIQYGVGDYLLKPINKEALGGTLEKMGERCRARRRSERDMERLREESRDDRARLRGNLVPDLLAGRYAVQDAAGLAQSYHFTAREDTYQVLLLKMDYDLDGFSDESVEIVCEKVRDIFGPMLSEICSDFVLDCVDAAMYGVLNYAADRQSAIRKRLRDCLNELVELKSLFGPVVFSLALGTVVSSAASLPESMDNARAVIHERLTEGTGRLLEGVSRPSSLAQQNLLARYVQDITHAVDVLGVDEATQAAQALREAAYAVPDARGAELLELVLNAGTVFISRICAEKRDQLLAGFSRRCGQCDTVDALFGCLAALQQDLLEKEKAKKQNQDGQPIRVAKQYIHQHYADPLTLEQVSAVCGFSVNYFSTVFKKETGEGFAKYLAHVRVEEAKRLLRETRLSVLEICKRVGYGDIKHFTRTFRSETGLTPGEFRKLYG